MTAVAVTCYRVPCQRPFSWRKEWEKDWVQVVYCSESCRRWKGLIALS
ncbi:DUF2256 domain-containing protein [Psychrobacter sp. BF1]|nr:DUF2256 domain-containing protein [Psychrobacter sp. BF1]